MSIWPRYILWNIVAEFNLLICDNTANGSAFLPDNIAAKGTVTSLERHVGVPKVCSWDLWSWQFTLWLSYLHIGKEPFCSERDWKWVGQICRRISRYFLHFSVHNQSREVDAFSWALNFMTNFALGRIGHWVTCGVPSINWFPFMCSPKWQNKAN